jgi:hypothetical protein
MTKAVENLIDDILATAQVNFSAVLVGPQTRGGWEFDAWQVTFTRRGASKPTVETFDYRTGIGHRDKHGRPTAPHPASVLYCLLADASGAVGETFAHWCSSYGYDEASRKALATYLECQHTGARMRRLFDAGTHAAIADALGDY